MNQATQNHTNNSLLEEIFLTPSQQTIAERFSPENQMIAADCHGKCKSGKCMFV